MTRLFVALNIPDEIRKKIINVRDEVVRVPANFRWEPENKIHLTLKFIGDVEDNLVSQISDDLNFINRAKQIKCSLTKFGCFYRDNFPKILWLGMTADENLEKLVEEVNQKLTKFNIAADRRKFTPHLTLKRFKGKEDNKIIDKFTQFNFPKIEFETDTVTLFKSELIKSGSVYTKINNYKLNRLEE